MTSRRGFLAGLLAAGLTPAVTWADVGAPRYLSAAKTPDGSFRLFGLSAQGKPVFDLPLPGRGHAAAAHPTRAEAVAFARRPGTFAHVIDCSTGQVIAELHSPEGRHFMGHGAFDLAGDLLLTPENDYEAGEGRIALWDRRQGYRRIGDLPSGGIGPHDLQRLPGQDRFVVANGGIDTHPESGRTALNLPTMRANLALLDLDGGLEVTQLAPALRLNSIRHLALRADGLIGFAMQWQGRDGSHPPLLGLMRPGEAPRLSAAPESQHEGMQNYAGSIAFSGDGQTVAITSPRGNAVQIFDARTGAFISQIDEVDVCGLSPSGDGFIATSGTGMIRYIGAESDPVQHDMAFDNHLIAV
ncbi:DUF1513 domain-containing protein [Thalassovita sp.]|uniref:DUF1513 domain-containing protein n=1 Tax=Thalassovita sp. TaxID=1979401 RepID=UPI002AAFBAF4|nr:DUF1513 domain-containing protein [Thalassovita sp.]